MGGMQVLMIVSECPAFWYSPRCCAAPARTTWCACACLALYGARLLLYSALDRPAYYLPVELLHGVDVLVLLSRERRSRRRGRAARHRGDGAGPAARRAGRRRRRARRARPRRRLRARRHRRRVSHIGLAAVPAAGVALGLERALRRGEDPAEVRLSLRTSRAMVHGPRSAHSRHVETESEAALRGRDGRRKRAGAREPYPKTTRPGARAMYIYTRRRVTCSHCTARTRRPR